MPELSLAIAPLRESDLVAVDRLDERAFGPGRYAKTAYRLREGRPPDLSLSSVARVGTLLVGANRMTPINVGRAPALLLGPLTVEPAFRDRGIGHALMTHSIEAARSAGHSLIVLVGDEPFYATVGFKRAPAGKLSMPGPVDPSRLLYLELVEGALEKAQGAITRVGA